MPLLLIRVTPGLTATFTGAKDSSFIATGGEKTLYVAILECPRGLALLDRVAVDAAMILID